MDSGERHGTFMVNALERYFGCLLGLDDSSHPKSSGLPFGIMSPASELFLCVMEAGVAQNCAKSTPKDRSEIWSGDISEVREILQTFPPAPEFSLLLQVGLAANASTMI